MMVRVAHLGPWRRLGVVIFFFLLTLPTGGGCAQKAPPELLQALETLDRQLVAIQGAEFAPDEYARFIEQWMAARRRLLAEGNTVRWLWTSDQLRDDLHRVHQVGLQAVSAAQHRRGDARRITELHLEALEQLQHTFTKVVEGLGGRVLLGESPMETALLAKQARIFFAQDQFARSQLAIQRAHHLLNAQTSTLIGALGRYTEEKRLSIWRKMARQTVEWSRNHHVVGIVVTKADRRLTLYRNGSPVLSYPVRLGYNGLLDKDHQGDGATPEGQYHVIRKRDRGQTKFYRAFLLDYPNEEDRRRFRAAQSRRLIPVGSSIGGQIEIHGGGDHLLNQTLGCIVLKTRQIDRLFDIVEVGTPVTIVGATEATNPVAVALALLEGAKHGRERRTISANPALVESPLASLVSKVRL